MTDYALDPHVVAALRTACEGIDFTEGQINGHVESWRFYFKARNVPRHRQLNELHQIFEARRAIGNGRIAAPSRLTEA